MSVSDRILVINPNSSVTMTRSIDESVEPLRSTDGPPIEVTRLTTTPDGLETQADVESVVLPLAARLADEPAAAYVVACFSDPGLFLLREQLERPVVGIAESALLLALGLGHRFGIVAIGSGSIGRHMRLVRSMGLEGRFAGDISAETGTHGVDSPSAIETIAGVGRVLREKHGAEVLILGCAGMGRHRTNIEAMVGVPVVDPVQAGVARALALTALGYPRIR